MPYSTDVVVIDLEATCLSPDTNEISESNILEIGAVRLARKTLEITDTFSELVYPRDIPLTPFISNITGITPEMLTGSDPFDKVGSRFVQWYGKRNRAMLAAFGVYYDIPLLRKEFRAFGLDYRSSFVGGALDIRSLALGWLADHKRSTTGVTLENILERMGLPLPGSMHRALDDALAGARVLQFIHSGKSMD